MQKKSLQTENRFGRTFILGMAKQPTKHCFFYLAGFPLPLALFTKCAFDLYFLLYIYHFLRPLTVKRFFM